MRSIDAGPGLPAGASASKSCSQLARSRESCLRACLAALGQCENRHPGHDEEGDGERPRRRRRRRRGGRGRRPGAAAIQATFDHGDEGYGLWLDPAVADNPVYAENWAAHRQVEPAAATTRTEPAP